MRPIKTHAADLAAIAVLVLLVMVAFADVVTGQRALYVRDVSRFFVPNFAILRDLIRAGSFPFWNSRYNAGQPFAANPAYAALYPAQWAAALFGGLQLEIVAHYLLAAIGMYVFLRSLRLRPLPSLFGALSFSLGGMLLSLSNLVNVLFGVSWFPWLAFAVRRRNFALSALILGVILIIGDQAVILQAGFLLIAYAIRRGDWKPALLIIAVALAVGSAQIIPALDHQRESGRAVSLPYSIATQWTLPPTRLLELTLPSLFGSFRDWTFYWAGKRFYGPSAVPWVFSFYSGMLVFVLACAGFLRRIRGWAFTAAVVAISYMVSIFPVLYLIGLRSIRYPEKFFIAGVFTLIVFASIAADQLLDDERLRRTAAMVALVVAVGAAVSLLWVNSPLFARTWQLTGYFGDYLEQARSGAIVTITTAAVLAFLLAARRPPLALLALFVLIDLAPRVKGLTPRIDAAYYDPPAAAIGLRGARVYNDADWRLALLGAPPIPVEQRAWRVRNGLLPESQAIWGVEAVLENDITLTNLLPSIEFSRLFWAAQLGRRADLVQTLLAMAGTTHVAELRDGTSPGDPVRIVRLGNPRFYFADQILSGPIVPASHRAAFTDVSLTPAAGRVVRALEQPNKIDLDVEADGNALLVISVTGHKYWRATIDGTPAALHATNVAFQSVVVSRGRHHVALRYRNPLVMIFGFVSIVSALLLVVFSLRSKAPQPPWPH